MLTLYNTMTRKKETFHPLKPPNVQVYVCGVTVYDDCHLGHARTYVSADVLVRYLTSCGFKVNYVRNITDIDDKIIKRAEENGEAYEALTARNIDLMHEDFAALGLQLPSEEPRATHFIPEMIKLIEKIIKNNHAYFADNGDVYFDVKSFAPYGSLSHHRLDELESGARVEVVDVKRDPLDFVLWKKAKPNEPSWPSPWGEGRPGWHIECSAMSMELLGEEFDIHFGGRDLIFPHHENELAQSTSATHKKFAHYWMHAGFLQIEKEKMSKSLKNFVTIKQVLKEHEPEVLRFLFIGSHYRSPLTYSNELLIQAKQSLMRFYTALRFLPESNAPIQSHFETNFMTAMDDDLNTPVALSVLFDLAHEIHRLREYRLDEAAALGALLKKLAGILGILQSDPEVFFKSKHTLDRDKIEALIEARQKARLNKDWKEADRLRNELSAMSIVIEDGANGTTWRSVK